MDDPGLIHNVEQHVPILGLIASAVAGVIATLVGWHKMRQAQKMRQAARLNLIEQVIGKQVLEGEESLATDAKMNDCRDSIIASVDQLKDQLTHNHERIDKIYDHLIGDK